jgi:hypothetical protein
MNWLTQICARCGLGRAIADFYQRDKTCKHCRREMATRNRLARIEYYRNYDKTRDIDPARVQGRLSYQTTEAGREAHRRAQRAYLLRKQP